MSTLQNTQEGLLFIQDSIDTMISKCAATDSPTKFPQTLIDQHGFKESNLKSLGKSTPATHSTLHNNDDGLADDIINRKDFDTMKDVRDAAIRYAKKRGFAVSTLRSSEKQLVLVCKHSGDYRSAKSRLNIMAEPGRKGTRTRLSQKMNCPFEIRAKCLGGNWMVCSMNDNHNHEMAGDIRAYAQYRKITPELKEEIIKLFKANLKNKKVLEMLNIKGYNHLLPKDIENQRMIYTRQLKKKQQKEEIEE